MLSGERRDLFVEHAQELDKLLLWSKVKELGKW